MNVARELMAARDLLAGQYVSVRELPDSVRKALKSVGFNKRDISLTPSSKAMSHGPAFEGNRSFVALVNLRTGKFQVEYGSFGGANPFEDRPVDRGMDVPLREGIVAIVGESGGRGHFAELYVLPGNLQNLLPESDELSDLSVEEKLSLKIIGSIKGGYRADEFREHGLGRYGVDNSHVKELLRRGLVKANASGAIQLTTKGKTVASNLPQVWQIK